MQFLLDWRLTTNAQYRQTFDAHWQWLLQQDCQTEVKTITFKIWLTAYQSGQYFPLPVKPDWRGMCFEEIKLSARLGQVLDWSGANLAGCKKFAFDFKGLRFVDADFSLADIRLSYFERCDFRRITASDSTWHRNRFWHCQGDVDWQQHLQTLTEPLAHNFMMPNATLKQTLLLKLQLRLGTENVAAYSRIISGKVCRWDAVSGDCLTEWVGRGDWVNSVAVSPNGSRIIYGGFDSKVRLWDVSNGDCLAEWAGRDRIKTLAFSRDGQSIFIGVEKCLTRLALDQVAQQGWIAVAFAAGYATLDANLTPIALQGDAWKYLTAVWVHADGSINSFAPTEAPDWDRIYRP